MELVSIHLLTLLMTAMVIVYSDHQGLLYFLGRKKTLSVNFLRWSHYLVWTGLLIMIATGVLLTLPAWTYRLQDPVFFVKMGFVLVLVINAFAIGALSRVAGERPFIQLTLQEKRTLMLSGAISAISWLGASSIGLLFL